MWEDQRASERASKGGIRYEDGGSSPPLRMVEGTRERKRENKVWWNKQSEQGSSWRGEAIMENYANNTHGAEGGKIK